VATNPHTISRELPAITLDLATTRQRFATLLSRIGDDTPDAEEDRLWDELEQRQTALEIEFDAAVYAMTGVSWDMLSAVRS